MEGDIGKGIASTCANFSEGHERYTKTQCKEKNCNCWCDPLQPSARPSFTERLRIENSVPSKARAVRRIHKSLALKFQSCRWPSHGCNGSLAGQTSPDRLPHSTSLIDNLWCMSQAFAPHGIAWNLALAFWALKGVPLYHMPAWEPRTHSLAWATGNVIVEQRVGS